jgi:predicted DNA-binding ribbon-helix-helix protein
MTIKTARVTINFSDSAMEWLNQEATRRNLSVSELIRRIIDELRGDFVLVSSKKAS